MKQQNSFSRTLANETKMGAYFTDLRLCKVISSYIDFGSKNVNLLEPTIGDASAVLSVTQARENVSVFGVELDEERYKLAQANIETDLLYRVILSDFLKARITNRKMDMVFANPPYLTTQTNERFETICLSRCTRYLAQNGLLVYVIGKGLLQDEMFRKYLVSNYTNISILRFPTVEEYKEEYGAGYQYFNQVCIFGYKRAKSLNLNDETFLNEFQVFNEQYADEIFEVLSNQTEAMYSIKTSHSRQAITEFKGDRYDVNAILKSMGQWSVHQKMSSEFSFDDADINTYTPPIDPKKEHKFFIAISSTSAILGDEGEKHLLRTFVTTEKTQTVDYDTNAGDKVKVLERTNSKVVANVLNADGTIISIM